MNVSTLLAEPPGNDQPDESLVLSLLDKENVPDRSQSRRWVSLRPPSRAGRFLPRFVALGAAATAMYLIITCATHLTKPVRHWKLGRGLASGEELGDTGEDGSSGSISDLCGPGQTAQNGAAPLYSHTDAALQRVLDEISLSKSTTNALPDQPEHIDAKLTRGRSGVRGQASARKRRRETNVGLEAEALSSKKAVLSDPQDKTPGPADLPTQLFSDEVQLSFWLSRTAKESPEKPPSEGIRTQPPSGKGARSVFKTAFLSEPRDKTPGRVGPSTQLFSDASQLSFWLSRTAKGPPGKPSSEGFRTHPQASKGVGALGPGNTDKVTVFISPSDIFLESLLDDGDIILRDWFPEPLTGTVPISHFDEDLDLEGCEDVKCYYEDPKKPATSSADAGVGHNQQGSISTKVRTGPSSVWGQAVQSQTGPSAEGGGAAVVDSSGSGDDMNAHPFFRLPAVPPNLSAKQIDLASLASSSTVKGKPVFSLHVIRSVCLGPSLDKDSFDLLVDAAERLCKYALEHMDTDVAGLVPYRVVEIMGTIFFVVDALYCADQLLGANANSNQWWPSVMDRVKIALSSFEKDKKNRHLSSRYMKLCVALVEALGTYTRGSRPSAKDVVYLKRSLVCESGKTKFGGNAWDPWRRDERLWTGSKSC